MFIELHGLNEVRLMVNVDHIKAIQEITDYSKHSAYKESGAKSLVHIDDRILPVKETIVQVRNILKKAKLVGGEK